MRESFFYISSTIRNTDRAIESRTGISDTSIRTCGAAVLLATLPTITISFILLPTPLACVSLVLLAPSALGAEMLVRGRKDMDPLLYGLIRMGRNVMESYSPPSNDDEQLTAALLASSELYFNKTDDIRDDRARILFGVNPTLFADNPSDYNLDYLSAANCELLKNKAKAMNQEQIDQLITNLDMDTKINIYRSTHRESFFMEDTVISDKINEIGADNIAAIFNLRESGVDPERVLREQSAKLRQDVLDKYASRDTMPAWPLSARDVPILVAPLSSGRTI